MSGHPGKKLLRLLFQICGAGPANPLRSGLNSATGMRDLFIGFAAETHLVIGHAAAGENQMRVGIDEARHDHPPSAIHGSDAVSQPAQRSTASVRSCAALRKKSGMGEAWGMEVRCDFYRKRSCSAIPNSLRYNASTICIQEVQVNAHI